MGMFDYVRFECECPNCGNTLNSFQSKSGPCALMLLKAHKLDEFYGFCDKCHAMTMFVKPWGKKKWKRSVKAAGRVGVGGEWLYEHDKKFTKREIKGMQG